MFGRISTTKSTGSCSDNTEKLKKALNEADADDTYDRLYDLVKDKDRSICINGDIKETLMKL